MNNNDPTEVSQPQINKVGLMEKLATPVHCDVPGCERWFDTEWGKIVHMAKGHGKAKKRAQAKHAREVKAVLDKARAKARAKASLNDATRHEAEGERVPRPKVTRTAVATFCPRCGQSLGVVHEAMRLSNE